LQVATSASVHVETALKGHTHGLFALAPNLPTENVKSKGKLMTYQIRNFRSVAFAGLAACIGVALLPSLQAGSWDKMTTLTVNEPLQVPSCCAPGQTVTLLPGEYVMALVDSTADRHIVRIFDKDQKNVIATILAIPNYRLKPTGKTVFQYWEVPAGHNRALRAWFYPGDSFGQEFAYPKQTAAEIAALVKSPVPAIEVETNAVEDLKTAPLVAVDESGKTTELMAALPMQAPEPIPQPAVEVAMVQPEPVRTAVAETPALTETLPHTASAMPLIGLAGLVSLALFAAFGLSSKRRRPCGN
jgi:LPXTG-motif cell wall-anchored protein